MKQFVLLASLFAAVSFAGPQDLIGKKFRYEYDNGNHYQVTYGASHLTWRGLAGADLGRTETDAYRIREVAPDVFLVNWTENDGSYVNVVTNFKEKRAYSSGTVAGTSWFADGTVTEE